MSREDRFQPRITRMDTDKDLGARPQSRTGFIPFSGAAAPLSRANGMNSVLLLFAFVVFFTTLFAASAYATPPKIEQFLKSHCVQCHGPEKQKGDRRFDQLPGDFAEDRSLEFWQDIVDQLNLGEMPPEKANQPEAGEVLEVVNWVTDQLKRAYAARKDVAGKTVLRRLNRVEYDLTVRHLLRLEDMLADPTDVFPPDETEEHFNNIGSALITSDFLMQHYLSAAEIFIERAAQPGPRPETRKWRFNAPFHSHGNRHDGLDRKGQYQHIRKNTSEYGGFLWLSKFEQGVPVGGYYKIRFKAQGIHRDYPYDERIVGVQKQEPLRAALFASSRAFGELSKRTASDRQLAEFDLPDDAPQWFETTAWLDKGFQPRLTFPNGPTTTKGIRSKLVQTYPDTFQKFIDGYVGLRDTLHPRHKEWLAEQKKLRQQPKKKGVPAILDTKDFFNKFNTTAAWSQFFSDYKGPRVRVFEIELEGPIHEQWPPQSHRALFGDHDPTLKNAPTILKRFADRAFRRPATDEELSVLNTLVVERINKGDSELQALKLGLRAVLCSPGFLYLRENEGELDDNALASRLSYFLWSCMPDDELMALAAAGRLREPKTLEAQTERLLADPRSHAFVDNFTSRWLQLYKIGSMPPGNRTFREYFIDNLEPAMKVETRMFFAHLLKNNLPLARFLDSDFTFVNGGLARLYGIDGVRGAAFQKVALKDPRRGGLLGQASILTASANGIDTSPVIRGIWVLENILGTPPNPPPPDVEPLEPDIRGATTIRDQLKKHREVPTCNECHRKIDPLGFALENFDPIGGWRDRYERRRGEDPVVDASGQLPDGADFENVIGLKKILASKQDQFARCLTEKMLAYSMGRTLGVSDRPHVDQIVADLKRDGAGLQDLVLQIVASEPFRTK